MSAKAGESAPMSGFPDSSFKYTPLRHLRVVFVKFVQGLFGAAPPNSYRWSQDIDDTEIIISDESPINATKLQHRPAITFTRGPLQLYGAWIDDMMDYDFRTGQKTKSVLVPGTMNINCVSRNDLESEEIAWIVTEHIWLLREELIKTGFFDIGRQPQIGSPSPAGSIVREDQGEGWYVTVVTIPFQFYRTSSFTPLGRSIVNNIKLSIEQGTREQREQRGVAQAGHEFPLNTFECPPDSFAPDASDAHGRTPDPAGLRDVFLPVQPHPLDPSKNVVVRVVRPNRPGSMAASRPTAVLPFRKPCGGESDK